MLNFLAALINKTKKIKKKIVDCFFETLNSKVPKAASDFCSGFHWLSSADFLESTFMTGFGNYFQDHRRLSESRTKVTGGIFTNYL